MPSITTWTRLEPQCRANDVAEGLAARIEDPLWLLARQWQVGEFQGEDTGSPVVARWRGQVAKLSRSYLGSIPPNMRVEAPRFAVDLRAAAFRETAAGFFGPPVFRRFGIYRVC